MPLIGRNPCRHTKIVREWPLGKSVDSEATALQHCDTCNAIRICRAGKWSRWRVLPIAARPSGPGVVIRGHFRGLIG